MVDAYFKYLRDMSRKIAFRGGFDSCLTRHAIGIPGNHPKFYSVPNELEKRGYNSKDWIKSYALEVARKDGNLGPYIGSGFLMGRLTINGRIRTIAAPLLFLPVNAVVEDDEIEMEINPNDLQVNLDLMALMLAPEQKQEDESEGLPAAPSNLISVISECEDIIEKADWRGKETEARIWAQLAALRDEIMQVLRNRCPAMSKFTTQAWTGYQGAIDAIDRTGPGSFFPINGYFLGPAPSQVTTYGSLVQMIRDNARHGGASQNPVLAGLLEGTLNNRPHTIETNADIQAEVIDDILPNIPLSLSDKQKEAVATAWSSDISYIQGPPGTGKSHTITAMLLAGILMGKRVLLVSNKKAALDVVREKMAKIITGGGIAYAVRDESGRKVQRAELQELVVRASSYQFSNEVYLLDKKISTTEAEIKDLHKNITDLEAELGRYLESSKLAHEQCKDYVLRRDQFCRQYDSNKLSPERLDKYQTKDSDVINAAKIREWYSLNLTEKGKASPLELLKARAFLSRCVQQFGYEHQLGDRPDFNQINDYLEALHAYKKYTDKRSRIPTNPESIRQRLAFTRIQLDHKCVELIEAKLELRRLHGARKNKASLQKLSSILYFKSPKRLKELMSGGDIRYAIEACPIWAAEIKDLSSVLPFEADMFDLVVVDEASQVNIPEIVPAFYRGQKFCVVGDEKQLGLSAAGFFSINTVFERLTWQRHITDRSYEEASTGGIIASRDSILDFIIKGLGGVHVPKIMLNEHFRSKPLLAQFTSDKFYADDAEGGLRIMTQNGQSIGAKCFELRVVGGARESLFDYVENEVREALKIAKNIANGTALNSSPLSEARLPKKPSVGIISFMRDQRDQIRRRCTEPQFCDLSDKIDLLVGTPEEFQGNERDIMILTFGLGEGMERYSKQFFENPNRFNVATSRARHFTYAIIGACPKNATLLREYFGRFGYTVSENQTSNPVDGNETSTGYRFAPLDRSRLESEFERLVLEELEDYAAARISSGKAPITLHNQVEACGQKRLDFVILNTTNKCCVAVEVDGPSHYCNDSHALTAAHIDRCGILARAGWKIIHIEHQAWYKSGWLRKDSQLADVRKKLYAELDNALG